MAVKIDAVSLSQRTIPTMRPVVRTKIMQLVEPMHSVTVETTESATPKVDLDAVLNYMYKHLPIGTERKLENFNGQRKISVFRGDGYMNKITRRLTEPPVTFIRGLKNIGTNDEPKMVTKSIVFDIPNSKKALEIYYNEPGNSKAGVFINLHREDYTTRVEHYKDLTELRQDKELMGIIGSWVGKDL